MGSAAVLPDIEELLTVYISGQEFGIPILQIQDVLGEQHVTPVPLSNSVIDGALNLRGRIVTSINVRKRLGLPEIADARRMSVVVEYDHELFSLLIDKVGDVIKLEKDDFEKTPATLDPLWRDISLGVYRQDSNLLIVLDIAKLLTLDNN